MNEFKKPYLKFSLHGFKSLKLYDNTEKFNINNEYISSIYINNDLTEMYVELHKNITYKEFHKEISIFLDGICFNMLSQSEVDADVPYRRLELVCDGTNIGLNDNMCFKDTINIIRNIPASSFYESIISNKNAMNEQHVLYQRIFEILHNPNSIMRFLGLYNLLLVLVSKENDIQQKYVSAYLGKNKSRYEPYLSFVKNQNGKPEDTFTHLRNKIAHLEQTNNFEEYIMVEIQPSVIRLLLRILNDVICEKI